MCAYNVKIYENHCSQSDDGFFCCIATASSENVKIKI